MNLLINNICQSFYNMRILSSSSRNAPHVLFGWFGCYGRLESGGPTDAVLYGFSWKLHVALMCNSHLVFTLCVSLVFLWLHSYRTTDTAAVLKKSRFISSDRSDSHMIDNLSIAINAFPWLMQAPLSVGEMTFSYGLLRGA